ncbi:MAG TPA: glutaredoxin family protein [Steroidobacteraceae bacterium]|nr:glutaredoxin family protein [Steroidobacteraceae bacterium]
MTAGPAATRLVLLTRADCELCDRLLLQLDTLRQRAAIPAVTLVDVDGDPVLQRRWGLRVPVLLLDGERVCEQALDVSELLRLLRL